MNVKEDEKYSYYAQVAQLRERAATKMNLRNLVDCYVDMSVEVLLVKQCVYHASMVVLGIKV